MAWTNAVKNNTVWGNMRIVVMSCTADAATYNVNTTLKYVYGFSLNPGSLSTAGVKAYANSGAGGTAMVGYIGCSGFVSGDVFYITAYGR